MAQTYAFPGMSEDFSLYDRNLADESRLLHNSGMLLIDYFAGQCACGLLCDPNYLKTPPALFAADCYTFAKAMMEERKKHLK